MAKQEKETNQAPEAPAKSSTLKNSVLEESDFFTIETSLFILRGEVVETTENEVVVKPFRFDQAPMIRYHNGLSEPFLSEVILGRQNIVLAKKWVPK